jgi:lysophospholipase L1-like esterase
LLVAATKTGRRRESTIVRHNLEMPKMTNSANLRLLTFGCGLLLAAPLVATARESVCHPERWKDAMAAFEKEDQTDPPPEGGIVFVGSSSIRLWDLPKSFPDLPVINRGFGGSELCDSVHFFDVLVARHKPRVVVLYAGDNDVAGGKKAEPIHADFRSFVQQMKEKLPESRLVYVSIKPSLARWQFAEKMQDANRRIAAECKSDEERCHFVDVWPPMLGADHKPRKELFLDDGLHMNGEGYQIWASLLVEEMQPHQQSSP